MAGRRPLTSEEERRLLDVIRKDPPRDRALVSAQWFTGFRISEVLALTVGHVYRDGSMLDKIGVAPRHLKGKRGRTRWVPISPELYRALTHHMWHLRLQYDLTNDFPLFPSRELGDENEMRPLGRVQAYNIIMSAFKRAGICNDGRLGTHSLRKTLARSAYEHCGHDLMILKSVLGHTNVSVTQKYLEVDAEAVAAAIGAADFTRRQTSKPKIEARNSPSPKVNSSTAGQSSFVLQ